MERPFERRVYLSEDERRRFDELVGQLDLTPAKKRRFAFLRAGSRWHLSRTHLGVTCLLVPLGLALMVVSVLSWWPVGIVGIVLTAAGINAANKLCAERFGRWRSSRTQTHEEQ